MAETTSTKKLVPVQPAALRLPGRYPLIEKFGNLQSGWQGTECYSISDNKIGKKSVDKLPPGSQLFGFCLFRTFEIIVRLHEKKPGTVAIADRTCLLKILFRSIPQ